jgi:ribosomal protein L33
MELGCVEVYPLHQLLSVRETISRLYYTEATKKWTTKRLSTSKFEVRRVQ